MDARKARRLADALGELTELYGAHDAHMRSGVEEWRQTAILTRLKVLATGKPLSGTREEVAKGLLPDLAKMVDAGLDPALLLDEG